MANVYVLSDNGRLSKKGETLQLWSPTGGTTTIFPYNTDRLVIRGNVEITGGALRLLMRRRMDTVFLSSNGRFGGKLAFDEGKNVHLRRRQYEILSDSQRCLALARSIVCGKLRNQLTFVRRIERRRETDDEPEAAVRRIQEALAMAETTDSLESVSYTHLTLPTIYSV